MLRALTDIRDFRIYNQPNLETGWNEDSSAGIGALRNPAFEKLTFNRPGTIQIHVDVEGLSISDVKLKFLAPPEFRLIEIGPKSQVYKHRPDDPSTWTEIYSTDLNCTVRNLRVSRIQAGDSLIELPAEKVVRVIEQKPNPDYPRTTPKGGTGKGIWIR